VTAGCIVLIRHGETQWSRTGRHTGLTDLPLTPEGEEAARSLKPLLPMAFDLVLSSPLQRARRTAELAGLHLTAVDPDLLEWDYGAWEGLTTAEIRAQRHDASWVIWNQPIPSGQTPGEQLADIAARTDHVIERCLPVVRAGGRCALIAHGHVLRILTARWLGLEARAGRLFALNSATLSTLGFEHEQQVIGTWNSRAALTR